MKFEIAIKQTNFSSNFLKAVLNVIYTNGILKERQSKFFKQYDILMQHYNVMRILKGKYPNTLTPTEIKNVLLDPSNDVTRLVDKLVVKEWVERNSCPENRRQMNIKITKKGIATLDKMQIPLGQVMEDFEKNLTENEALQLSDLLDKLRG